MDHAHTITPQSPGHPVSRVAAGVLEVRHRIAAAAQRADRDPEAVTLVAVSKDVEPARILAAAGAGQHDFGESKAQQLTAKAGPVGERAPGVRWHFVGRLQRNKVDQVVGTAVLVHSVDRRALAEALDRQAQRLDTVQAVLVQVSVDGDPAKAGCRPEDLPALLTDLRTLRGVRCTGLMTVPAMDADPRPAFRALRRLRDEFGLPDLSMGMSDDFEVAVEEGATIVRVGRAIFGPRQDA